MRRHPTSRAASIWLGLWLGLFPLLPTALFAGGGAESTTEAALRRARGLIEARQYSAASQLLTDTARRDPDSFNRVSELMRLIQQARLEYGRTYAEVVRLLTAPPDPALSAEERRQETAQREAAVRALIEQLKAADSRGDFGSVLTVAKAKEATDLVGRRYELGRLMDAAARSLDERQYSRAVGGYLEALQYLSDNFQPTRAGNIDDRALGQSLAELLDNAAGFLPAAGDLEPRLALLADRAAGLPPETLAAEIGGLLEPLRGFRGGREAIEQAAALIEAQYRQLKGSASGADEFRLLAVSIARGREGNGRPEGLLQAIDLSREVWLVTLEGVAARTAADHSRAGLEAFAARAWTGVDASFRRASAAWAALAQVLAFRTGVELPLTGDLPLEPAAGAAEVRASLAAALGPRLPLFLEARERAAEADAWPALAAQARFLAGRAGAAPPSFAAYGAARDLLRPRTAALEQARADWLAREERLAPWEREGQDAVAAREVAQRVAAAAAMLAAAYREEDERLAAAAQAESERLAAAAHAEQVRLAVLEADGRLVELGRGTAGVEQRMREAAGLAEGVADPRTGLRQRDPGRALKMLQGLETEVRALRGRLDELLQRWEAGDERFRADPRIRLKREVLSGMLERITALEAQRAGTQKTAQDHLNQAQRCRAEGVRLAGQVRDLLRKGDFDEADQGVKDAAEAYLASLSFQEDEAVRRLRDRELSDLAGQIVQARLDKERTRYEALREEGFRLFEARRYTEAEQKALEAGAARAKIFDDPGDIPSLLERIRRANQFTMAAEVREVEATYPSIVRFYDSALGDFELGRRLGRDSRDGKAALAGAKSTVDTILKTFPFYFKAAKLDLQITQLRDPKAFTEQVTDLFTRASADVKANNRDSANRSLNLVLEFQPQNARARKLLDDLVRVQVTPVAAVRPDQPDPAAKDVAASRALRARTRLPLRVQPISAAGETTGAACSDLVVG